MAGESMGNVTDALDALGRPPGSHPFGKAADGSSQGAGVVLDADANAGRFRIRRARWILGSVAVSCFMGGSIPGVGAVVGSRQHGHHTWTAPKPAPPPAKKLGAAHHCLLTNVPTY